LILISSQLKQKNPTNQYLNRVNGHLHVGWKSV